METVNWNKLSVHIAIKLFHYFAVMFSGLIGLIAMLLAILKVAQPDLQLQSQKMTGEMINQPLPSAIALLILGLLFVITTYILGRFWQPRTPYST